MRTLVRALALVVLGACGGDGPTRPPTSTTPVARVVVVPDSVSLPRGQTMRLEATLFDAGGNVLEGRAVSWWSTNQTAVSVAGTGVMTAHALGTALVIARSETKGDTVKVVVAD
jgi:hypothetical protein